MRDCQHLTDEELVFLFKQGEEFYFDEIFARYHNKLLNYAIKISGSQEDAQEITDTTLLLAFKNLHKFRNESTLATWLYQILRNQTYSKYRLNYRKNSLISSNIDLSNVDKDNLFLLEVVDLKNMPEKYFINNEIIDNIVEAIEKLPDQLIKTAYLYFINEMPLKDIAQKLNCPTGTVKSRTFRIKKYLSKSLEDFK